MRTRDLKTGRYASAANGGGITANATFSRAALSRALFDPRRDINHECGYPETSDIDTEDYRRLYDRHPIAARVVQVMPRETWTASPSVYESENADSPSAFDAVWDDLSRGLRGTSWHQGETGSAVWEHLARADELGGIGSFGVLLLGLDGDEPLSEPIEGIDATARAAVAKPERKLLYLRAFDQSAVTIVAYEHDIANPRYGQPITYRINFANPSDRLYGTESAPQTERDVHWTRVIHIADNLGSSEVFGTPRIQTVYNRIMDLQKLYGGSAEMYWRGAFFGLALETQPQLEGDVVWDKDATSDQLEQYFNTLQRYIAIEGVNAKVLAPTVVDPSNQIDVQITAICILLDIPKRIFMGSERGELASSQDQRKWHGRVRGRQNGYVTPRLIVPFVDRLIAARVLPEPDHYTVTWPDLDSLTALERADIAVKQTEALSKYVQGGVEGLVHPMDYLTRIIGMEDEEAAAVLAAVVEEEAEAQEEVEYQPEKEKEE